MEILKNPGVITVIIAALALLYVYISAAVRDKKTKSLPENANAVNPSPEIPSIQKETATGELKLTDTDDETAAVIMAIVSHRSGIPLNRLSFKSIKLLEEQK